MRHAADSSSRPPERIFLLLDVSSKARVSVSVAKLFVKRLLAPRCDVFSVDDDSDGNDVNDERGRRFIRRMKKTKKKERKRTMTCTKTKFCARFYDASKTPSQMDGFVRRAIVQLQREEEEDKEEEEEDEKEEDEEEEELRRSTD